MTTILAVDDSATMRKCLEITFDRTEFNLVAVGSAQEALEKVKTLQPDLVIADVSLPPNDGYELCSTIKLAAPGIPVLLLSSKHVAFDASRGAQADDHIDKPFDTQLLQDRARGLISAGTKVAAAAPAVAAERPQPTPAAPKAVSMPERQPASAKIPAPRRKRPTPAMMPNPLGQQQKATPSGGMRRTVPFAMPGAAKRQPGSPADALRRVSPERVQSPGAGVRPEQPHTKTQPQVPAPETRPSMGDTMPGVKGPSGAVATPSPAPVQAAPTAAVAPRPAAPAAPQAAPAVPEPAAAATGAVVVPAPVVAELETKLEGLGLTKQQMEGVLSLSRELVEQVVWEVVPTLAETLIKEEIRRLTSE